MSKKNRRYDFQLRFRFERDEKAYYIKNLVNVTNEIVEHIIAVMTTSDVRVIEYEIYNETTDETKHFSVKNYVEHILQENVFFDSDNVEDFLS